MSASHILLVEDSQVVLFKLKAMLVRFGYTVTAHDNAVKALKWLKKSGIVPDLVVTDINMPDMDGYEFIRTLRANTATATIPIIVLTSKKEIKDRITGLKAGADDFMTKTLTASEFEHRIQALLSRTKPAQSAVTEVAAKTITVFSLKGGVGTTTLATNLAVALAQLWEIDVCLWDMALSSGHCANLLNLTPKYTLASLSEKLESTKDDEILATLFMKHKSGVTLLPAPVSAAEAELVRASIIDHAWTYILAHFPYLVVDAGNHFTEETVTLLDRSEQIILVTAPDILSIRSAADALRIFKKMNIDSQKIMVALNYIVKEYTSPLEMITPIIGKYQIVEIPHDSSSVMQSLQSGKPLLTEMPKSKVSLAITSLAYQLSSKDMESQEKEHPSAFLARIKKMMS
jgi:pilus assembly protein CpaE